MTTAAIITAICTGVPGVLAGIAAFLHSMNTRAQINGHASDPAAHTTNACPARAGGKVP